MISSRLLPLVILLFLLHGVASQHSGDWVTESMHLWRSDSEPYEILLGILYFILILAVIIYIVRNRRRWFVHMEGIRSMLASFPTPTFSADEEVSEGETMCTICRVEFTQGESVVSLPDCSHVFHYRCIEGYWLQVWRATCPNCRHEYIHHGGS